MADRRLRELERTDRIRWAYESLRAGTPWRDVVFYVPDPYEEADPDGHDTIKEWRLLEFHADKNQVRVWQKSRFSDKFMTCVLVDQFDIQYQHGRVKSVPGAYMSDALIGILDRILEARDS